MAAKHLLPGFEQKQGGRAPGYIGLLMVLSAALGGCLGGQDGCEGSSGFNIVSVDPPGYKNTGDGTAGVKEDFAAPVRVGETVVVRTEPWGCASPDTSFRWTLRAETVRGWGDFEAIEVETKDPQVSFVLPHVGRYWIDAVALDGAGRPIPRNEVAFMAEAFFVETATLPTDGSAYVTSFTAFCCPRAHSIDVRSGSNSPVGVQWVRTLVVNDTDEVIWTGRDKGYAAVHEYEGVLGTHWLEEIRVEIEPDGIWQGSGYVPGTYELEIRIGPRGNGGFQTV